MNQLFFELIQVAIGMRNCLSNTPNADEWGELYAMAKKQSLVGVCFAGVQKLQAQRQEPPEMLYLTWMGMAAKIQQRNEVVNRQCAELQAKLSADGLRSCILKGQGVAQIYPEHLRGLRQSGDIDIWIDGGFDVVNSWVQKISPTRKINMHHIDLNIFPDTEVEAHYIPFVYHNYYKQKKLEAFFERLKSKCMDNNSCLNFSGPTEEFNHVFLLVHIFHHFLTEGVGLRQIMDYLFVVKNDINGNEIKNVKEMIQKLGLARFASAIMWVLGNVFGLPEEQMLFKANKNDGKIVLERIMAQGNFGKQADDSLANLRLTSRALYRLRISVLYYRFDHSFWFWGLYDSLKTKLWQARNHYTK